MDRSYMGSTSPGRVCGFPQHAPSEIRRLEPSTRSGICRFLQSPRRLLSQTMDSLPSSGLSLALHFSRISDSGSHLAQDPGREPISDSARSLLDGSPLLAIGSLPLGRVAFSPTATVSDSTSRGIGPARRSSQEALQERVSLSRLQTIGQSWPVLFSYLL